jgi:outer membrane protein
VKRLDLRQPILQGTRLWNNRNAARADYKAGLAHLQGIEQQILLSAITAYAELTYRRIALSYTKQSAQALGKEKEGARYRHSLKDLTLTDLAQAESRFANARAQVNEAEINLAHAEAEFVHAIGQPPPTLPPRLLPFSLQLPPTLEAAEEQALTIHPEVIAASFSEKAASERVRAEVSSLLPDVGIEGSMVRSKGGSATGFPLYDNDEIRLSVRIPIFQGGAEYGRIGEARHTRARARYELDDRRQEILKEVDSVWSDYERAGEIVEAAQAAEEAAEAASRGMHEEQRGGQRSVIDTLDTEQELLNRQIDFARAQRDRFIAGYRLLAALGQLTVRRLGLPVIDDQPEITSTQTPALGESIPPSQTAFTTMEQENE